MRTNEKHVKINILSINIFNVAFQSVQKNDVSVCCSARSDSDANSGASFVGLCVRIVELQSGR